MCVLYECGKHFYGALQVLHYYQYIGSFHLLWSPISYVQCLLPRGMVAECRQILWVDTCQPLWFVVCCRWQLIWQGLICMSLQDMWLNLSASIL